jgi:hypothetical protein
MAEAIRLPRGNGTVELSWRGLIVFIFHISSCLESPSKRLRRERGLLEATDVVKYWVLTTSRQCVKMTRVIILNLFLLVATLGLIGWHSWRAFETRTNPDFWTLRDDVDGLLKRESTRLARERASHRRAAEGDSKADSLSSDTGPVGPFGGVVRPQPIQLAEQNPQRRARGG